jgi:hypothetical protein
MAAPGAAFAGQPGRRAGHRHLGAHQASLRAAAGRTLRAALYRHAFNPTRRATTTDPAVARALGWLARASLPATQLIDPQVTRAALDALMLRLDGSRAAASTIARNRAVFHDAAGYAVELGLLPRCGRSWRRWLGSPRS